MEFIEKLKITFRENNIEVLEFTNEKDFIKYKCLDCGEVYSFKCARNLLSRITLCKKCYNPFNRWNKERLLNFKIKRLYPNSKIEILSFNSLRQGGEIKCLKCGETEIINNFEAVFSVREDFICKKCEIIKNNYKKTNNTKEKQTFFKKINEEYELLKYKGEFKRNLVRHKCGFCFYIKMESLKKGKGCPKCYKKMPN